MFYQAKKDEFNLATPSQDLYYSYHLYEKYGYNCKNIILTYSVFSKGLCLIKTKEIELCILLKEIFKINYQFKAIARRKNLYWLEPLYRIQIKKYFKNSDFSRKRKTRENEIELMNTIKYIQERAKKHYKNYLREDDQLLYLDKFMEKTKENEQNLILILPPAMNSYKDVLPNGNELFEHLIKRCEKYKHIKILDFYNSNLFTEDDFIDGDHLNENGQIKITEMVKNIVK